MDIIGIGTDIVEIARLQKVIDSHGKHFLERVYTECELELLADRKNSITLSNAGTGYYYQEKSR